MVKESGVKEAGDTCQGSAVVVEGGKPKDVAANQDLQECQGKGVFITSRVLRNIYFGVPGYRP